MKKIVCIILSALLAIFAFGCVKPEIKPEDDKNSTTQINEIKDLVNFTQSILAQEGYTLSEKMAQNTAQQTAMQFNGQGLLSVNANDTIQQFKQLASNFSLADPNALKPDEEYLNRVDLYKLGFPFYFDLTYLVAGIVNDYYNVDNKVYDKNVKVADSTARLVRESDTVRSMYIADSKSLSTAIRIEGNAEDYKVFKKAVSQLQDKVNIFVDIIVKNDFHISLSATIFSDAYASDTISLTSVSNMLFFFTDLKNKKLYNHITQDGNFANYSQPLQDYLLSCITALKSSFGKAEKEQIASNLSVADIIITQEQYEAAETKYIIKKAE